MGLASGSYLTGGFSYGSGMSNASELVIATVFIGNIAGCLPKPEPEETLSRKAFPQAVAQEYCEWVEECLGFEEYGGDLDACEDVIAEIYRDEYSEEECAVFDEENAHDCFSGASEVILDFEICHVFMCSCFFIDV